VSKLRGMADNLWRSLSLSRAFKNFSPGKILGKGLRFQGGIEMITPSFISGWVLHSGQPFSEVRMTVGPHLICCTSVDKPRPDVEHSLGVKGDYGFVLVIPGDFPLIEFSEAPTIIAVVSDGSTQVQLKPLDAALDATHLLKVSFSAEFRGLQGHFDGFDLSTSTLLGWCFHSRNRTQLRTVYLHGLGSDPIPLRCNHSRPDLEACGFSTDCGFNVQLNEYSPLLKRYSGGEVWVTFDSAGLLRLPQDRPCFLWGQSYDSK
jgi:hypothetical protein